MYPINKPEVMISNAAQRFDENGNLKDEETKSNIQNLMTALVKWAKHHEGGRRATTPSA
jgi:chromate reductase